MKNNGIKCDEFRFLSYNLERMVFRFNIRFRGKYDVEMGS